MDTFPDIKTLTGLNDKDVKPANRKKSAAGYPISFSKGTVLKREFVRSYSNVSSEDKVLVRTFFNTHQGDDFYLPEDPSGSTLVIVTFAQDELDWLYMKGSVDRWEVQIRFSEV